MEHNEDLARLEQFVDKLVDNHNQLKKEKIELLAQLQEKQKEIAELQETVNSLKDDRSLMHDQVTGLIGRIDEWEKMLNREGAGNGSDPEENKAGDLPKESSSLFNVTSEQPV